MRTFRIVICEVGSLKNRDMEKVMRVCVCMCMSMCHLKNKQMSRVSKRT